MDRRITALSNVRAILLNLMATVFIATVVIFGLIWHAASLEYESAEKTQIQSARFVTETVYDDLADKLALMSFWQDAFDNTVVKWNAAWVDYQFGAYQDSVAVDAVVLADPDGAIKHYYSKKLPFRLAPHTIENSEEFADMVRAIDATPRSGFPKYVRGIVMIGGRAFFGTASRITPEHATPAFNDPSRDIIAVYLRRADASAYRALNKTFGISGIEISPHGVAGRSPSLCSTPMAAKQ